jgi:outer membrane protein assembly factor BamB
MKNYTRSVIVMLVVAAFIAGCQGNNPPSEAVMYRGGARRTGVYDTQGIAKLTGAKWKFETGGAVWSSPVVAGGVVYFGSDDGYFYAVDVETGQEKWRFETGDDVRSSPAIANNAVYFESFDGYLYAVNVENGEKLWKYNMTSEGGFSVRATYDDYLSSPAVVDGTVYFGTLNPERPFCAVDAQTGEERWCCDTSDTGLVHSSPVIFGNTVYFGSTFGVIYASDTKTGQEKWRFEVSQSADYAPAIDEAGTLYFGSKDTYFYALDGQTGEEKWKSSLASPSWVTGSPIVAGEMVYIGSSDARRIFALETDTGEKVWEFNVGGYAWASPALADGVIYAGSGNRRLYAIDAQTGQELWQFEAEGAIYSSPMVADGSVYFGSVDGYLYALH